MKEGRHFMAPLLPTTSHGQPHPRYRHAMTYRLDKFRNDAYNQVNRLTSPSKRQVHGNNSRRCSPRWCFDGHCFVRIKRPGSNPSGDTGASHSRRSRTRLPAATCGACVARTKSHVGDFDGEWL